MGETLVNEWSSDAMRSPPRRARRQQATIARAV
jgi:hypothetical protein